MYRNKNLKTLDGEIWVDAFNYEGSYSVSNMGRIKSERRQVNNGRGGVMWVKQIILSQSICPEKGRLSVGLSLDGIKTSHAVSVLVWESFNKEVPTGKVIMHKNKNQSDNRLCNLQLTTWSHSHSVNFQLGLLPHLEQRHSLMGGSKWNEDNGVYVNGELTEILCNKCFIHKPVQEFDNTRNCCKKCRSFSKGIKEPGKLEYLKSLKDAGLKRCYICTEIKSINDFYRGCTKCKICTKNKRISIPMDAGFSL